MELSLLIAEQILIMLLMIGVGVALVRFHIVDKGTGKSLSEIVLYVILPCTIINAFQIEYSQEVLRGLLFAFGAAIVFHVILILFPYILRKKINLSNVEMTSLSYPNCGEILIPLVVSVLSQDMQIYCCAFLVVQICVLFTHGITLISGTKKFQFRQIMKNVNVIAILIGLFLFLSKIQLPFIISRTINSFSGMVAPMCMLVIGIAISDSSFREIFNRRSLLLCLIRLIGMPLLILVLIKISGAVYVIENGKSILLIVFMATASSSAATVANIAQKYEKNAQEASTINVLGTLLLVITLPLMVALYQMLI